ncbi:MAG: Y-family DNA polymerase [Rhizobiaceae bacterium]
MKNYLSVWLPRWPIERRFGLLALKQGNWLPPDERKPLVLSTISKNGAQITAANPAAEMQGFMPGMTIADARAIDPSLLVETADKEGDSAALRQLALWCQRYSPLIRIEEPDGICINITGCAHLFGGEVAMANDLADRLHGFGVTARLAITSTIGAGWALARYGPDEVTVISGEKIESTISPLPIGALRLDEATLSALTKVGLNRVGLLIGKPRAPLAARFGHVLLYRLDQALGTMNEVFDPLNPPPFYRTDCRFAEPIVTLEAVEKAVRHLVFDLTQTLFKAGKGTRRVELALYRVDGWQERLGLRISSLNRDPTHLSRLLCERLHKIKDNAGFGFEAAILGAFDVEKLNAVQSSLPNTGSSINSEEEIVQLLDRLVNRFGGGNVTSFVPRASYIPERSIVPVSVLKSRPNQNWQTHNTTIQGKNTFARPLMLFRQPEEITAIFEAPDKPPATFKWRNISHRVTHADGPERIAPEWWLTDKRECRTRDYYRVEDEAGHRFWVYRDGLFERSDGTPKWFIHGVFS